ncbi:MAG: hypothetical protein US40_C0009G0020 [Candidatus Roizmanbacteria bacterium GW2011_GWC2_37_13]|uniref:Phosphoribosyl pyrophosphate synthase n=1 Tax=Candidatus Roizmanbacteria bacterium GW2011_GWC2_37_13 TaxID=1618486 RepID=A0A0G0IM72_9BACT|nr:MAG: hypothetical protein US38_C0009G0023 [Candidatus Roizmanbacteria bacterium GW2011_GWC1_37_12]KKQ25314.1 MAG: hypothetical protein US40_C0009G0020 [Candidatus Roizmanbacteria bacterium GW2011_GWC2_37_13]
MPREHQSPRVSYDRWKSKNSIIRQKDLYQRRLPVLIRDRITFCRSIDFKRDALRREWNEKRRKLTKEERQNFQIVVINSPGLKNPTQRREDVTLSLIEDLEATQIGPHPVATVEEYNYSGNDPDSRLSINNMEPASRLYIVASLVTAEDFRRVNRVVWDYKRAFGNKTLREVVLVSTHFPGREDKSGKINKETGKKTSTGQTIAVDADLAGLTGSIDRHANIESHSGAMSGFAADHGVPSVSLSPYKPLLRAVDERSNFEITDPILVGPDEGRNFIVDQIATERRLDRVDLEKDRSPETMQDTSLEVSAELLKKLRGKDALLYDDEGATLGTIRNHIIEKLVPAGVKSITILLAHVRFTNGYFDKKDGKWYQGWEENLNEILALCNYFKISFQIFVTNSREPVGDLDLYRRKHPNVIHIVDIKDYIKGLLLDDINDKDIFRKRKKEIIMH